jgi:curli biogenesis system outer membrane secretion channel CsgG
MFMAMFMAKKTTVILRDDVYQTLKETAGARNISSQINKILIEHFAKTESMFGVMKKAGIADLRDHKDRCL